MASPLLPEDAIFEILTRLPLQTLAISNLVCSSWNRIANEPAFTDLHPLRTKTAVGYFIQPPKYGTPTYIPSTDCGGPALSLSFLPKPVKIAACDRGILLCVKERRDKHPYVPEYYVCKPTTNEFTKIPNPKTRFDMEKIAIVVSGVSPLRYKIVRVSSHRGFGSGRLACEVYDSGLGAWKRLADIKLPYGCFFRNRELPVIIGDEVVWLLSNESLFVFGSLNETWEILPVPEDSGIVRLTKHEGKLCLLQYDDFEVNVWTMENREWKKKKKKKKKKGLKKVDDLGFIVGMKNADVAVFADYNRMRFYNFATESIKNVKANVYGSEVFFFSSDYEPCNLFNSNS